MYRKCWDGSDPGIVVSAWSNLDCRSNSGMLDWCNVWSCDSSIKYSGVTDNAYRKSWDGSDPGIVVSAWSNLDCTSISGMLDWCNVWSCDSSIEYPGLTDNV